MILFKELRYKNFLSTGNVFTRIYLNKNSSTLILGRNGEGKCVHPSTIVDVNSVDIETQKKLEQFLHKK